MPHPAPSAEFQLDFLAKVERILSQGQSTTTYKFAMLIALTNIAVEKGSDSGDPLEVDLDDVARQWVELYWNMARPYPRIREVLRQSTNAQKPAAIITLLEPEVRSAHGSYQRLRAYGARYGELVAATRRKIPNDVLYRLQTIGKTAESRADRFLYDHPETQAECARLSHITLKPGVAACLRRLRGVITAMVEARWARWIREKNEKLAADSGLERFLFGAERTNVAAYAERFYELQNGRCLYSGAKLDSPKAGEVDHFIPWARYPFDSPFNLALASKKVNNKCRDELKSPEWRKVWLARNEAHSSDLTAPEPSGFGAVAEDAETAKAICEWVYAAAR